MLWFCGSSTVNELREDENVSSSSLVSSLFWSSVTHVVFSCVAGLVVPVLLVEVVGRAGRLSLLFMISLSNASHFEVSFRCGKPSYVARDVVVLHWSCMVVSTC